VHPVFPASLSACPTSIPGTSVSELDELSVILGQKYHSGGWSCPRMQAKWFPAMA
jgi:hypothetical protein